MKPQIFLVSFLLFNALSLSAQFNPDRLYSPYQAVATHLNNLSDDNYQPEIAAMTFQISDTVYDDRQQLAVKLLQIFRGAGVLINLEDIPNEPDYLDSLSGRHIYRITKSYPDIYVEKVDNRWYYSSRTAERIDEIHKSLYPFGVDKIMELAPKLGDNMYFGLHLWQYIIILIIILLSVFIHKIFTLVIENIIIRFLIKNTGHMALSARMR
jgi:MscS family membrane protein